MQIYLESTTISQGVEIEGVSQLISISLTSFRQIVIYLEAFLKSDEVFANLQRFITSTHRFVVVGPDNKKSQGQVFFKVTLLHTLLHTCVKKKGEIFLA